MKGGGNIFLAKDNLTIDDLSSTCSLEEDWEFFNCTLISKFNKYNIICTYRAPDNVLDQRSRDGNSFADAFEKIYF